MAKSLQFIDIAKLREAVKALNEGCKLEAPIKIFGISKEALLEQFANKLEELHEAGTTLPVISVAFYNDNLSEEAVDPEVTEDPKPEGEKKRGRPAKEKAEKPAKEEKPPKEKKERKPPPRKKMFTTFEELVATLAVPANPTEWVDHMTAAGTFTAQQIVDKTKEMYAAKNNGPGWSIGQLKQHLKYRQNHGWLYEVSGDGGPETIYKLVGYQHAKTSEAKE